MKVTDELRSAIIARADPALIEVIAINSGMVPIRHDALQLARGAFGQLLDEQDLLGHLVAGDPFGHELLELALFGPCSDDLRELLSSVREGIALALSMPATLTRTSIRPNSSTQVLIMASAPDFSLTES